MGVVLHLAGLFVDAGQHGVAAVTFVDAQDAPSTTTFVDAGFTPGQHTLPAPPGQQLFPFAAFFGACVNL
jgi:hypothetical protein